MAHWMARRYRLSNEYNHTALHYYRQLNIQDEMADTLNNAAYVYALLGDISRAEKWIDDALELRRELGQGYPLALSLNTRGLIHVMAGEPHRALLCCQEALSFCQRLEDWRGQGLAYNALGLVYRKLGNLNRLGLYKLDQALDFYKKAEDALHEAIRIFREEVLERIRLVEAHNELGSVYRYWAILLQEAGQEKEATQLFEQALTSYKEAIRVAGDDWPVDRADSYEDMADVFALLGQPNRAEEYLEKAEALVPDAAIPVLGLFHLSALHISPSGEIQ
jgi:tetratricopeptide (TPR) repeat protein